MALITTHVHAQMTVVAVISGKMKSAPPWGCRMGAAIAADAEVLPKARSKCSLRGESEFAVTRVNN